MPGFFLRKNVETQNKKSISLGLYSLPVSDDFLVEFCLA